MKRKVILFIIFIITAIYIVASAQVAELSVIFEGEVLRFDSAPIISNDRTLVQLRPIAEKMKLEIEYEPAISNVILSDGETEVRFIVGSKFVAVNGLINSMGVEMAMKDDYTFVPVRNLVEPFGYEIAYDEATKTVTVTKKPEPPKQEPEAVAEEEIEPMKSRSVFYYQSQPEFEFSNNGRGYCWVCSYAMVLTNVMGKSITPVDIANLNEAAGYEGSYMSGHEALVGRFGAKLVPALSKDSKYFASFNAKNKGETRLNAATDEEMYEALKEALDNFSTGIMVRVEAYPHSMVAVGYDDRNIYFNDPGLPNGENIPFDQTSVKGYKLSDITFIQALSK